MARTPSRRTGKNPYAKPDAYALRAKAEGYPARSVYKLEEIDKRCRLFRGGQRVLDLGCAPGSWTLYAAQRVGRGGSVRGIDLGAVEVALPPNARVVVGDALELDPDGTTAEFLRGGAPYDVILSDMAPSTTGNRFTDQVRSADLVARTLDIAEELLAPGGSWVAKIFMSEELQPIRARVRSMFETERVIRPEGTRSMSYEVFLIGQGRLGRVPDGPRRGQSR